MLAIDSVLILDPVLAIDSADSGSSAIDFVIAVDVKLALTSRTHTHTLGELLSAVLVV